MTAPVIEGDLSLPSEAEGAAVDAVVRLEDTTMADAPSVVLAEARVRQLAGAPPPLSYSLDVPAGAIRPGRGYTLSACAEVDSGGERALLATVQSYPWRPGGGCVTDLELRHID